MANKTRAQLRAIFGRLKARGVGVGKGQLRGTALARKQTANKMREFRKTATPAERARLTKLRQGLRGK